MHINAAFTSHLLAKAFGLKLRSVIHANSFMAFALSATHCERAFTLLLFIIAFKIYCDYNTAFCRCQALKKFFLSENKYANQNNRYAHGNYGRVAVGG